MMFNKITDVEPLENYHLLVHFETGDTKKYDVGSLFEEWSSFRSLERIDGLYKLVKIDPGGYGISWNDEIDISSDELYQNGVSIS
jgi:hypothetical protein